MMIILILILIIFSIIIFSRKENFNLSSEVYNNINNLCDTNNVSYINKLNISENSIFNNKSLNTYILDKVYPIGSFYVQYPAANSNTESIAFPNNKKPGSLFPGTTWTEQWKTEGIFFRTEGRLSDIDRISGKQNFAMKRLTGKMSWVQSNLNNYGGGNDGVFGTQPNTTRIRTDDGGGNDWGHRNSFNIQKIFPQNTSQNEIRVKNRLFKIWKRTG